MEYQIEYGDEFLDDLDFIEELLEEDPRRNWTSFIKQLRNEMKRLDQDPIGPSRACKYPPLSTYRYRKRYFHSIPLKIKQQLGFEDLSSDFRLVFKVNESTKVIYFHAIGPRIKERNPKNPNDIWSRIKKRKLPEQNLS